MTNSLASVKYIKISVYIGKIAKMAGRAQDSVQVTNEWMSDDFNSSNLIGYIVVFSYS